MKHKLIKVASMMALGIMLNGLVMINVSAADIGKLVEGCDYCHGKDGASTNSKVPIIGGFSAPYMIDAMKTYKNKERPCPEYEYPEGPNKGKKATMCEIADDISEGDTKELANHFAAKPFVRATNQPFDPVLAEKGKVVHEDLCVKCHDKGGSLPSDDSSILAGQWMDYTRQALKDYSAGKRPMIKKMEKKYKKLNEEDFEALVHYFGSFK
ncbi:MAG: c-type cytochrome [Gammaproteobacteria bacterium]|nr:c-type cytochrome [Gammaproteobacteria bacterium]